MNAACFPAAFFLNQLSNFVPEYFGNVRLWSMPKTPSSMAFTGLRGRVALTMGANGLASVPMKSVLASILSLSFGPWVLNSILASWMMSDIFTPDGQATSQRLQFRQYFSASSKKYLFFSLRRSPSGPACLGPGYSGLTGVTGQYTVQIVHLMHCSKLFSFVIFASIFYLPNIESVILNAVMSATPAPQPS